MERGGIPFELVVDAQATVYERLGIGRMRWFEFFRPTVAKNYVLAFAHGGRQGRMTGDVMRLSGVAVLDATGDVAWTHVASALGDYPPIETVLDALRATSSS